MFGRASEEKTYKGTVNADGTLSDPQLFLNQGGENIAQDAEGTFTCRPGRSVRIKPHA
jgi:hypothetical protein